MDVVSFENYSFCYPGSAHPALEEINLKLRQGELILLCGESGSGKSTLLRSIKPEIAPVGEREGHIALFGQDAVQRKTAGKIGFVAQNPENQIVMDSVWHELAFGLENMGLPSHVIRRRIAETANFFGIEPWIEKKVYQLSGGQKQILNLAAVMVMQPALLLLDEPTAQLDPIAAKEFLQMVGRLNRELGMGVILSEHRLEEVLSICSRVVFLKNGKIAIDASPQDFVQQLYVNGSNFTTALPAPAKIAHKLGMRGNYPLNVQQGRAWLQSVKIEKNVEMQEANREEPGQEVLAAKHIWFQYGKDGPFVLKDASIAFYKGQTHAIVGSNGSGKSTLLHLLCGSYMPRRGKVKRVEQLRIGLLSQNPQAVFACESVIQEMRQLQQQYHYTDGEIEQMLNRLGLAHLRERHPYDLSGGEMQKAALAKILLLEPDILLLDEPTKGIDAMAKQDLANILRGQEQAGRTVILVTHDIDFAAAVAQKVSMLFEGSIICSGGGKDFFESNMFYTTQTNRMTRGIIEGCITVEDVYKIKSKAWAL